MNTHGVYQFVILNFTAMAVAPHKRITMLPYCFISCFLEYFIIGIELPSSPHKHISKIMDLVLKLNPYSILDVGTGFGKYGVLCREYLELWDGRQNYHEFLRRIDGVEAHGQYITPLHKFVYNNIYSEDVLTLVDRVDYNYDLFLLIDVLEHFDKPTGRLLLKKILLKSKGVLISTPKNPSAQKNAFNNDYEIHRAKWTRKELSSFSNCLFLKDKTHLVVYIGTNQSVRNLKKRIFIERINKIPGATYLIATYMKSIERKKPEKVPVHPTQDPLQLPT